MCQTGWVDLAENLGHTFCVDPHGHDANSKIDFVFANPEAQRLVADVKLQWIAGYQHAAIEVTLHLSASTGALSRLVTPKRRSA